jgi:CubicO group peptidase (beta-lactamase class C family)
VGLPAAALDELDERIRNGDFGYVDRLVVVRHGQVVVDGRYDNDYREISRGARSEIGCGNGCPDPEWDHQFNYLHPDWHPYYQGRDVHTLQSVTKSVAATLIGIAIEQGAITGVDSPLLAHLDGYDLSAVAPALHRATLQDLLTMRTGIEWHEIDRPIDDSNTTFQLEGSEDWVRFTLSQPMDAEPGEKWAYNSGGSHLMAAILQSAAGTRMDRYAEENLFGPLGIEDYHWKRTPAGLPDALGGLYLEALDLARIGYLYLRDGVWEGERILPEGWAAEATAKHVSEPGYGYQWWRPDPGGEPVWAGQGFGGQYLLVLPERDVVVAINSWNLFGLEVEEIRDAVVSAIVAEP